MRKSLLLVALIALFAATNASVSSVGVAAVGNGTAASLEDYWNGNAEWVYHSKFSEAQQNGEVAPFDGAHVTIVGSTWYLFQRYWIDGVPNQQCVLGINKMLTRVRTSTDKGLTWSAPTTILSPDDGVQAWSCVATDGDAYYNATENKWYYLFQCLENISGAQWKGCLATRLGADPSGPFTTPAGVTNPVIQPRSLWDQICNKSGNKCGSSGGVFDEGTYEIFKYDGTYYWVGFHGFNGTYGFRGVAKTTNFVDWIAGDPAQGVPGDAVLGPSDATPWRENVINQVYGPGAAGTLQENSYYYTVSEFIDKDYNCTTGQNWDIAIFRTNSLTSTSLSPIPRGNPIVYSTKAAEAPNGQSLQCPIQYMRLFKDPNDGFTYFTYGQRSNDKNYSALYFYRLERTNNLLRNADAWKANTDNWGKSSGVNLSALRLPNNTTTGTPYFGLSCNGTCQAGQVISQSMSVSSYAGSGFTYGGSFATDSGSGSLNVYVDQLDSGGNQIATTNITVSANTTWASPTGTGTLLSNASTVRFRVEPNTSSINYRVDDLLFSIAGANPGNETAGSGGGNSPRTYEAEGSQLYHAIGRADGDGWSAATDPDGSGQMIYGPYATDIAGGSHTATYRMLVDNNTADNGTVVTVDVFDATANTVLASRDVTRQQWASASTYQNFDLNFSNTAGHSLEFRVYWHDISYVKVDRIDIDGGSGSGGGGSDLFFSGVEIGEPGMDFPQNTVDTAAGNASNVGGYCCGLSGMELGSRANEGTTPHTGGNYLMFSGDDQDASVSYSYMKVFDVNIAVTANTSLEYWIYPQSGNATCVGVDLVFTDGSVLRNMGATDQNGRSMHPNGRCGAMTVNAWNQVKGSIGGVAGGKTIDRINIVYDQGGSTGTFRGYVDDIRISNNSGGGDRVFEAEGSQLYHAVGRADGDGWSAATDLDGSGQMIYGPYATDIAGGSHTATYRMLVDNNTADNGDVVTIDVHDATAGSVLASSTITRQQWNAANAYQDFTLNFTNTAGHQLEFRVYWRDISYVRVDKITVN
jgi:hypothetical protein